MDTTQRPYTQEMVMIHRVFRRDFGMLPGLIRRVPPDNPAPVALLAGWRSIGDPGTAALYRHRFKGHADRAPEICRDRRKGIWRFLAVPRALLTSPSIGWAPLCMEETS